jgi:hypothetical protein
MWITLKEQSNSTPKNIDLVEPGGIESGQGEW